MGQAHQTIDGDSDLQLHPGARLRLNDDLHVIDRGDGVVQLGTEPSRRVLITACPPDARRVLCALDGTRSVRELLAGSGAEQHLGRWLSVLGRLVADGLVDRCDAAERAAPHGGSDLRAHLAHRYAMPLARTVLVRRNDAIVQLRGAGRVAAALAVHLATGGIGAIDHRPDRPMRSGDLTPPATTPTGLQNPAAELAARLRAAAPHLQLRRLPPAVKPSLVVLAGDGPADPVATAPLVTEGIAHLAVWAGAGRAIVGPLVLPGRSSCLWCAELLRVRLDPAWPAVRETIGRRPITPTAVLADAAAVLAASEVFDLVDGVNCPRAVDGTTEWSADTLPRRRNWPPQPDCGCRSASLHRVPLS